jgi:hypothetical protein
MKPILPIAAAIAFTATFLRTTKSSSSTARKIVTRAASTSSGGNEAVTKKNIPKPICKRINHDVSFGVVAGENRGEYSLIFYTSFTCLFSYFTLAFSTDIIASEIEARVFFSPFG